MGGRENLLLSPAGALLSLASHVLSLTPRMTRHSPVAVLVLESRLQGRLGCAALTLQRFNASGFTGHFNIEVPFGAVRLDSDPDAFTCQAGQVLLQLTYAVG